MARPREFFLDNMDRCIESLVSTEAKRTKQSEKLLETLYSFLVRSVVGAVLPDLLTGISGRAPVEIAVHSFHHVRTAQQISDSI